MNLHFKKYGNDGKHLIILHGLFGMLDNWHTLATRFSKDFTVWIIDARNHGKSPWEDTISYPEMADDLADFFIQHHIESAYIIGHSMGGKTAMQFATVYPEKTDKLIVVDIAPKEYIPHHDEITATLQKLDLKNISTRKEAEEALSKDISEKDTILFLLKNLTRTEEGFAWKMNLKSIVKNYSNINAAVDVFCSKPTLFIRGGNSNYISDKDISDIKTQFSNSEVITFPNTGHWVHAEQPDMFYNVVKDYL